VRVAKGSRGGESAKQSKFAYEFDCPYLADESELDDLGGHELAFAAIEQVPSAEPNPNPNPNLALPEPEPQP
jgi:hypothetical protein